MYLSEQHEFNIVTKKTHVKISLTHIIGQLSMKEKNMDLALKLEQEGYGFVNNSGLNDMKEDSIDE